MARPRVVVFGESSLDGRITLAPDVLLLFGDPRWPTGGGEDAQERLIRLHGPQALLEGSGSFVLEGMEPEPLPTESRGTRAEEDFLPRDIADRRGFRGWFVVVDGRGRVRWLYTGEPGREAPGSEGWHLLVLVSRATPGEYLAYLEREHVPYLIAGGERVDLRLGLEKLGRLGVSAVLVTSPGRLGHALLRAGCVDEIDIDILPAVIGGTRTPTLFEGPDLGPDQMPTRLTLRSAETREDGRVLLRYDVPAAR